MLKKTSKKQVDGLPLNFVGWEMFWQKQIFPFSRDRLIEVLEKALSITLMGVVSVGFGKDISPSPFGMTCWDLLVEEFKCLSNPKQRLGRR